MELHARQQFDFLLMTAVERFTERLVQRSGGAVPALAALRDASNHETRLFVAALFQDFLLDNPAGACFVLEALSERTIGAVPGGEVSVVLVTLARQAFGDLLTAKAEEALEQAAAFE